jgi:hypothetical protein
MATYCKSIYPISKRRTCFNAHFTLSQVPLILLLIGSIIASGMLSASAVGIDFAAPLLPGALPAPPEPIDPTCAFSFLPMCEQRLLTIS